MKTRANELLERTTKQQKITLAICIGILVLAVFWFLDDGAAPSQKSRQTEDETTRIIADLTRGARAERSWLDISENRFNTVEQRLKRLEADREKLTKKNDLLTQRNEELADNANQAIDVQAQEIERLRLQLDKLQQDSTHVTSEQTASPNVPTNMAGLPNPIHENPFERARNNLAPKVRDRHDLRTRSSSQTGDPQKSSSLIHFNLDKRTGGIKDLKRYIPAGSYAPAEVISGVDAAVGVNAQADTQPILFRITGAAVSAALGNTKQTADIEGCTVTGAAYGDLSSEKVYSRLQTMTCTRKSGFVFETEVQGYMAGNGKAGVRGTVVSREGDLITRSFLAGAVGGIGGAASQSLEPTSIDITTATDTASTQTTQPISDILKSGIGQGLDNAGSKVSDYLIERAEQYQPVVILQADTKVELVFIKGVDLQLDGTVKTAIQDKKP